MNRKHIIAGFLIAVFLVGTITTPAAAGSRQRGRWEGFALGFGAAVLGHTLLHQQHAYGHYKAPVDRHPPRQYHHRRDDHRQPPADRHRPGPQYRPRPGHWEWQRVWVAPTYKKVWKQGHRNHRGRWVPGCWEKVPVAKGYWKKSRVWVAER